MTTSTQARFMDALEKGARERLHTLVVDTEWANTGTVYAVADGALEPTGARLRYSFHAGGPSFYTADAHGRGVEEVAAYSKTGTVDWCYDTLEKVLAVVLDQLVPSPPESALRPDGWADVEIEGSFAAHLIYDDDAERLVVENFTFVPNQDAKTYLLDGTVDDDWDIADVDGPFWKAVQEYLRDNTSPGPYANVLWVE